jgi:hypothetical protein
MNNRINNSGMKKFRPVKGKHYVKKTPNYLEGLEDIDLNDHVSRASFNETQAEILNGIISEFFDSYILLAVDTKGEGQLLKKVNNFQQKAAISRLLEQALIMEDQLNNQEDEDFD